MGEWIAYTEGNATELGELELNTEHCFRKQRTEVWQQH